MTRCSYALKMILRRTWDTKIVYLNRTQKELILCDQYEPNVFCEN